jgi:DNA-binding NtrC family response regulator
VVLAKGAVLEPGLLPISIEPLAPQSSAQCRGSDDIEPLHEVERRHIARALASVGWNKRRACALLQISRPTLDRKIDEFGIKRELS